MSTSLLISRCCLSSSSRNLILNNNGTRSILNNSTLLNKWQPKQITPSLGHEFHSSCIDYGKPFQIKMPALSPTMTEGTIVKWHKKEGDKIAPGETIFEVQTDKAVIPFELEEDGIMAKILLDGTSTIQVGSLIALMVGPDDDWKNVQIPEVPKAATAPVSTPPLTKPTDSPTKTPTTTPSTPANPEYHVHFDKLIGPVARMLIQSYQIEPSTIKTTGHHGLILKSDVLEHIRQHNLSPKATVQHHHDSTPSQTATAPPQTFDDSITDRDPVEYEDIELSNMRKVIAKRLIFSKTTIPHSYMTISCPIDTIIELRKEFIKNNQKVSLNDFIIKALGVALKLVPEMNSNEVKSEFKQLPTVDISVAVATPNGLITPIVKDADRLSVLAISERVKGLADKARLGKLQPHEFQGGSFSISNLGMFGISEFSAVINPPQVGIMAVGKSQLKLNLEGKSQTEISFSLSYDERCVDLDRAAKFMNTLNYLLSNPALLVDPISRV